MHNETNGSRTPLDVAPPQFLSNVPPSAREDGRNDRRSVDERRQQLVDATIQVLAEEGLSRATTRRITDQAGLALGAFHYAFRSKDELLEAVIERVANGVEGVFTDAAEKNPPADLTEAVTQIVTGFWDFIEESPDLQLAQYELTLHALREPSLRKFAVKQYERYSEAVGNALDRFDDAPTGQDRDDIARFVVATIDGLVLHSFVDGSDVDAAKRRLDLYLSSLDTVLPEAS